jgi:hypothetical protein
MVFIIGNRSKSVAVKLFLELDGQDDRTIVGEHDDVLAVTGACR